MPIPSYTALAINDHPLVDSWQNDSPYIEPVESDMDGGNKRLRTKPGDELSQLSFSIMMSKTEYATFKTFASVTLGRGASRFTMRIWNGSAMVSKTVQMVKGVYSTKTQEPKIIVSFSLYIYGGL